MNLYNELPEQIVELLSKTKQASKTEFEQLVRKGGYLPPDMDLLIDAISALSIGKNHFIKRANRIR